MKVNLSSAMMQTFIISRWSGGITITEAALLNDIFIY